MPARDAAGTIAECVAALLDAGFAGSEICVVDDGSTDRTADRAEAAGARAIRLPVPLRPARARNAGVAATNGEIVVFVDADVLVAPHMRERIVRFFADHPDHDAVFGSYDDRPPATRAVGRYRNLLHHYVHQNSRPDARTFWTGLGAVRRDAFLSAGELDPAWESIEDVEFGLRLSAGGRRIRLDRGLLGTHLKDWSLGSMVRTDWKGRAVPWTRLLVQRRIGTGDLNLSASHRASAALVALTLAALCLAPALPWLLSLALAAALGFVAVNLRFLAFLARREGVPFALRAILFHAAHYTAGLLGYLQVRVVEPVLARPAARPSRRGNG